MRGRRERQPAAGPRTVKGRAASAWRNTRAAVRSTSRRGRHATTPSISSQPQRSTGTLAGPPLCWPRSRVQPKEHQRRCVQLWRMRGNSRWRSSTFSSVPSAPAMCSFASRPRAVSQRRLRDHGALAFPLPIILGHEGAGVVEDVGPNVTSVKPGDHVVLSATISCGLCRYCQTGRAILCEWGLPTIYGSIHPDGRFRAGDQENRELHQFACIGTSRSRRSCRTYRWFASLSPRIWCHQNAT